MKWNAQTYSSGFACVLSILSVGGTAYLYTRDDARDVEAKVYNRILDECYQELKPAYKEFDIEMEKKPTSFAELVQPLTKVQSHR